MGGRDVLMDGGCTRNLRAMPPIEKPMSWVDITTNHWSERSREYVSNTKVDDGDTHSQLKLYTWL